MKAVVLSAPGPVENLQIRQLPIPEPESGWVRIKVAAFGLNRSELHTRLGLAEGVTSPRVLGIECVGIVDAIPDGDLQLGQQVAAMMGGMGRTFDGGYAEYTVVPRTSVIPYHSDLPWEVLAAIPETFQTANGSLTTGLDLKAGQTLLIRGGTSALGLVAAALAKDIGARVLSTTRRADRRDGLGSAHHVVGAPSSTTCAPPRANGAASAAPIRSASAGSSISTQGMASASSTGWHSRTELFCDAATSSSTSRP